MASNIEYLSWLLLSSGIYWLHVGGTFTLSPNDATDYIPTNGGRRYQATLSPCASDSQVTFTWRYVDLQDSRRVTARCGSSLTLAVEQIITLISHPLLSGNTFRLQVTTDNPKFSVISAGTFTFPANYSLTGSREFAILGQPFTWTCKTFRVKPPGGSILGIRWTRGLLNSNETYTGENVATVGIINDKCEFDTIINPKYIYYCTNDGNFILTIPAQNMTLEEQHTWWRCRYYTELDSSIYGSNFQQLSIQVPVRELKLSSDSIIVEDGNNVTLSCRVNNDSNPVPILQWSLDGRNLTSSSVVDVNTPYISTLTYTGSREDQNKTISCAAGYTTFKDGARLTILYPPDVAVVIRNKTEGHRNVSIRCRPLGSPTVYHFHGWEHYYMGRKVRNVQDLQEYTHAGELLLPRVTYQDQGTYVCLVDNGIKGRSETVVQRGQGYMDVKASAVFPTSVNIYFCQLLNEINISVPVYSNPLPTSQTQVKWIGKYKAVTIPYAQDSISISPTNVEIQFFETNILVEGVLATWTIKEFTEEYIGNYSLVVNNGIKESWFDFSLQISGPPWNPLRFSAIEIFTDSVIFLWVRNFNGEYQQTFHIFYNDSERNNTRSWIETNEDIIIERVNGLKPSTWYSFWLFSENLAGRSENAPGSPIILQTKASSSDGKEQKIDEEFSIKSYIGGAFSVIFVVLVILIILYMLHRRRRKEVQKAEQCRVYDSIGERKGNEDIYNDLNMTDNPQPTSENQQEGQSVYVNTAMTGE